MSTPTGGAGNESGAGAQAASGGEGGEPTSTVGNPCQADAECDDKNSCTGAEACTDGVCVAGEGVECPSGLRCSAAQNNACVFAKDSPWILYGADAETAGVYDVWGIKPELLGEMKPVKISPKLAAGDVVFPPSSWSPDGSSLVMTTTNQALTELQSYLVRFGDALPDAPIHLTKGLSASKVSTAEWSRTGKVVAITRDDGIHVFDVSTGDQPAHSRATGDTYTASQGWLKSDTQVVFLGKNALTQKTNWVLATSSGGSWSQEILVADLPGIVLGLPSPDRSLLAYQVFEANQFSLWVVETTPGSKPTKVAGPSSAVSGASSPDATHVLLAATSGGNAETDVRGGSLAELVNLPVLKQHLKLPAQSAIGAWAPDSSRAVAFQDGAIFGRQVVMHEPGAGEPWQPLEVSQAVDDTGPVWSPASKAFAIPTRTSAASALSLSLVESPAYTSRAIANAGVGGAFFVGPFSADGGFFVYVKGPGPTPTDGYYVDLRQGLAKAPEPVGLPGAVGFRDFASKGAELVYVRDNKSCVYLDLATDAPEPATVNPAGSVISCSFQKLP